MMNLFICLLLIVLTFIVAYVIGHEQGYRDAMEAHVPDVKGEQNEKALVRNISVPMW